MSARRIVGLSYLTLAYALSLLVAASLVAFYHREYFWTLGWAPCLLIPLGLIYVIFGAHVADVAKGYISFNPTASRRFRAFGLFIPLVLSLLIFAATPVVYAVLDRWGLKQYVARETPLKHSVADVCDQLFRDPAFMSQIPHTGNPGYYQIGTNEHVLIREDESGNAYWFDVADSLSSYGYACIRPGIDVKLAISNYEFWVSQRHFLPMYDNLYWWN